MELFRDRIHAGELLAQRLAGMNLGRETCVMALPRGGVPVAWEISRRLEWPLDLLFVKKIGAPSQPELAIGAVAEAGKILWQRETIDSLELSPSDLEGLAKTREQELSACIVEWRKGKTAAGVVHVKNKTVVVVDDGLATGASMIAALHFLRSKTPKRVVVAVPIASEPAAEAVASLADEVLILRRPSPFFAVGQWYRDFRQVTDEEVHKLLGSVPIGVRTSGAVDTAGTYVGPTGSGVSVHVPFGDLLFEGRLIEPKGAKGLVIFAHGNGSNYTSSRNQRVASALNGLGFATLLFDLLTTREAGVRSCVLDIPLLIERLRNATEWTLAQKSLRGLPVGYFGASTGTAAALGAAALGPNVDIKSVVSRGGRPDLAFEYLRKVTAKVLLIVGANDHPFIELNEHAKSGLRDCKMAIIPRAGHVFEGDAMDEVIQRAGAWFEDTLVFHNHNHNHYSDDKGGKSYEGHKRLQRQRLHSTGRGSPRSIS